VAVTETGSKVIQHSAFDIQYFATPRRRGTHNDDLCLSDDAAGATRDIQEAVAALFETYPGRKK
jgi:hypothetical protein